MTYQIRKYYKIIPLLLISVLLMFSFCLDSFAETHLGLAAAVKSRVQQLKEENDKKLEENIVSVASDNGDEGDQGADFNHLPVITALTANPTNIPAGAFAVITCSASDPDNDSLVYSWSAASGTISGIGSQITWTAPSANSAYTIYCTVSDGKSGTTRQSVRVAATASAPPIATVPSGWTKLLGTNGSDAGLGVAADSAGNIYITGLTIGNLDGNTNQGKEDMFLTKYDTSGAKLWTKLLGTDGSDEGLGVATDSSGNIYVTGYTFGNIDGNTNRGWYDIFLTKYDPNGVTLWTKQLGTNADDAGLGVVADSSGNIYVTGYTNGNLNGNTNQGGYDIFLTKYDTNGAKLWTKQFGTSATDEGLGVATDQTGNIYITGITYGDLDGNTNQGGKDIFLAKYDTNGAKLWIKQLGTSVNDESHGLAVDQLGNIYIDGLTNGNLDSNTNQGGYDMFLTKYDNNGAKLWTKQLGTTAADAGLGVATDYSGNIYVTGYTNGDLDGNINQGGKDIFLAKYDTNGAKLWTEQLGTSSSDEGVGVTTDQPGNIYITGYTNGNLDGNLNQGLNDIFLIKFIP